MDLVSIIRENASPLEPIPTDAAPETPPLKDIRAVVFDVYGTLIASGVGDISLAGDSGRSATLRKVLQSFDLSVPDKEMDLADEFHRTIHAMQEERRQAGIEHPEVEIREVWERFLESLKTRALLDGELTLAKIEQVAVTYEMAVNPVWPMPGLASVLESLQQQAIPTGIISNAQFFTPLLFPALTDKTLDDFRVEQRCCIWSYLEREAKPSTNLYKRAAEKWEACYKIRPKQILYVGNDMRNDIWPARKTGFRTALFAGDQRSLRRREDHTDAGKIRPDWVITELMQIVQAFGGG